MIELIGSYSDAKSSLAAVFGASEDLLHLHAGLAIFFVTALLFHRRMRSPVPIVLVYLFAFANELIDAFSPASAGSRWEPALDVLNTVVWPTLLFLLARRRGKRGEPDKTT